MAIIQLKKLLQQFSSTDTSWIIHNGWESHTAIEGNLWIQRHQIGGHWNSRCAENQRFGYQNLNFLSYNFKKILVFHSTMKKSYHSIKNLLKIVIKKFHEN